MAAFLSGTRGPLYRHVKRTVCTNRRARVIAGYRRFQFDEEGPLEHIKRKMMLDSENVSLRVDEMLECLKTRDQAEAMRLFWELRKRDEVPTAYSYGKIIAALARNSFIGDAEIVYNDMVQANVAPDFVTLSTLLSKYSEMRDLDGMERSFRRMKEHEIKPNTMTFKLLMEGYFAVEDFSAADQAYRELDVSKVEPDIYLFEKIMRLHLARNKPDEVTDAYTVLRQRKMQPTYQIFLCLIEAYVRRNRLPKAIDLLKQMKKKGAKPDETPFAIVTRTCAEAGDTKGIDKLVSMMKRFRFVDMTALTYNHVIEAYGKRFGVDAAEEKLELMIEENIKPNANTLYTMLRIYNDYNDYAELEDVTKRLYKYGVTPNSKCYTEYVRFFIVQGQREQALQKLNELRKDGKPLGEDAYAAVIQLICKQGKPDDAEELLHTWIAEGTRFEGPCFQALLEGFSTSDRREKVKDVLRDMTKLQIHIPTKLYAFAIYALIQTRAQEDIFHLFQDLRNRSSRPNGWLYEVLVKTFCERDILKKAREIVAEMDRVGIQCGEATFLHFINIFIRKREVGRLEETLEQMKERRIPVTDTTLRVLTEATKQEPDLFKPILRSAVKQFKEKPRLNIASVEEDQTVAANIDIADAYSYLIATSASAARRIPAVARRSLQRDTAPMSAGQSNSDD
eukprot:Plantae.Rhodophyta-Purpureofilum_apyrenoidigerum.ctg565.p1 GENE.Plantae.Rhodophyta-Purpureofilum_apyrenoidigerum.ctg565~~Plantae.Rhodophyta-Purpureofilum_apyrenoidigerum.ctg565.p1  ORF type:complete len:677 (-),score=145.31 Plantae.Rhodophyta-Purpureofilum_apyrenoidigerum.ctg565:200-2230(-)